MFDNFKIAFQALKCITLYENCQLTLEEEASKKYFFKTMDALDVFKNNKHYNAAVLSKTNGLGFQIIKIDAYGMYARNRYEDGLIITQNWLKNSVIGEKSKDDMKKNPTLKKYIEDTIKFSTGHVKVSVLDLLGGIKASLTAQEYNDKYQEFEKVLVRQISMNPLTPYLLNKAEKEVRPKSEAYFNEYVAIAYLKKLDGDEEGAKFYFKKQLSSFGYDLTILKETGLLGNLAFYENVPPSYKEFIKQMGMEFKSQINSNGFSKIKM